MNRNIVEQNPELLEDEVLAQVGPPVSDVAFGEGMESELDAPSNPKLTFDNTDRDVRRSLFDQITQRKADNSANKSLLSAFIQGGNVLAKQKLGDDKALIDGIEASERLPLENLKEEQNRETVEQNIRAVQTSNAKHKGDIENQMARRDPRSLASRQFVNSLMGMYNELGEGKLAEQFKNLSYDDAVQLDKTFGDTLNRKRQNEELRFRKQQELDSKKDKESYKKTNELGTRFEKNSKDDLKALSQYDRLNEMMDELITNPEKYDKGGVGKLATMYGVGKLFDPDSAVREGELKLLGASGTVASKIRQTYNDMLTGRINQDTLESMREVARLYRRNTLRSIAKKSETVRRAAEKAGIPIEDIGGGLIVDAMEAEKEYDVAAKDRKAREDKQRGAKSAKPVDKNSVIVSNGTKTFKIPRSRLSDAEADGFKEVK